MKTLKHTKIAMLVMAATMALGLSQGALAVEPTPTFDAEATASTPLSTDRGITPYIISDLFTENPNPGGGNRTCEDVGLAYFENANYYQCYGATQDYGVDDLVFPNASGNPLCTNFITTSITVPVDSDEGTFVQWSSLYNGTATPAPLTDIAAIVKGSNDANIYVHSGDPISGDSGLASPIAGGSGGAASLSNLTFCWNPPDPQGEEDGQWCSPGYWRNHLGSWPEGFSPDDTYQSKFEECPLKREAKGTTIEVCGATLRDILANPDLYNVNDQFNKVGDLLSEAHLDVDFSGTRVEDSCPLN